MQSYLFYVEKTCMILDKLDRRRLVRMRRIAKVSVGVLPVVVALLMCAHCATLIAGRHWALASLLCKHGVLFFILMMVLSYSYDFCALHRMFCIYDFLVSLCIWWQLEVGFGPLLPAARIIMLIFGAILFAELYEQGFKKFLGC